MVAASKESVAFFGDAERHLTLCVEVDDETKVMGRQDIKRLVSAVNTHMLAIYHGKKATCLVKVMHSVHFFESCRGVQTFGDLAKPLSVHASLVILLKKLSRGLELSLNKLLAPVQLLRVENDLVLLVYHLALQLADLALKELHFLGPGESLAGHCRAVYRSSSINHARIRTGHIDRVDIGEATAQASAEIGSLIIRAECLKFLGEQLRKLLAFDTLNGRDLLT